MVGTGAGDIGENNTDPVTGLCKFCQRASTKRMFQCLLDGGPYILDRFHRLGHRHVSLHPWKKSKFKACTAVGDFVSLALHGGRFLLNGI
jgi:hypothetical protein